ncbi:unnamed protein product [Clavelina lepadiformis]|uniref:RGS domain-containing protein n=1 Tax=Clavelina lepadiformis TaxID=159417 RepID=A0ABP0GQK3_CLALP
MKSIDIVTSDSLEESLSCDDLFLEYFNKFLTFPAFPQRLCYSRFTGTFHDLEKETPPVAPICDNQDGADDVSRIFSLHINGGRGQGGIIPGGTATAGGRANGATGPIYAAKDDERERLINWAKEYRLPFFLETQMYRELKLCKLLVRPLDPRRGSSRIRGYSRLSIGYTTTTSMISGTLRNESPLRALTSLDDQSSIDWAEVTSDKFTTIPRPTSKAFSLPPNMGLGRTFSATALYETSATESSSIDNRMVAKRPCTHKRRYPITSPSSRRPDQSESSRPNLMSDSGLGTAAVDYAQSGMSGKTRTIATRADTLGVGSRWESEEGYSTRTAGSRSKTAMTSSSLPGDGYLTPASPTWILLNGDSKYEGKSALRTAESPSKPHRATIVLPKTRTQGPMVRIAAESSTEIDTTTQNTSKTADEQADDEFTYDDETNDVIDDEDDDFDDEEGVLDFDDRDSSCEETETEIATIEKVHSMSLQHIKERIFRTKSGMDSFVRFLRGTPGQNLFEFWLDTEEFKDSVTRFEARPASGLSSELVLASSSGHPDSDESALRLKRHRLFRNILDRYKFSLTSEATEQIRQAQANQGLSYRVFSRAQYDVLRRLRSYWLPRFVIHKRSDPKFKDSLATGIWDDEDPFAYNPVIPRPTIPCLPLLSVGFVNFPDKATPDELTMQTLESATAQVAAATAARPSTSQIRVMSARSGSLHTVLRALEAELEAGFPFQNYTRRHEPKEVGNTYAFLMSLEYLIDQSADKRPSNNTGQASVLLNAVEAYSLYQTFLIRDSPLYVKPPRKLTTSLSSLQRALRDATAPRSQQTGFVSSSLFRQVKQHAVAVTSACLKRYRKHEIAAYHQSKTGQKLESPTEAPTSETPETPLHDDVCKKADDESLSESATTFSNFQPYYSEDDSTETDSASTMYSYDVERIRQLASSIRQKGAKKPQRPPPKKVAAAKKVLKTRGTTAAAKGHLATKVQFILPGSEEKKGKQENEEDENERVEEGSEEDKKRRKKKNKKTMMNQHPNRMTFAEIRENKLLYTFMRKYISQCESVEVQNMMQMFVHCDTLMSIPATEVERRTVLATELARTYIHSSGPKQIAMPTERSAALFRELPNPTDNSIREIQDYVMPSLDQAAANFSLGFGTLLKEYKLDLRSDLGQHINKAEIALKSLTLKPSSKRRRALGKHSARQTPTSDHKVLFLKTLDRAKEGSLPVELLHFYKYLQGFGVQEGFPLIHNDLMFYIEVNKFIASFHDDHDIVTLKRKVISIRDCYVDSQMDRALQIDIKTGTAERLRRAMDAFVEDKGRDPHTASLFDDAQHTVFNELLPFWAGFVTAMSPTEREGKRPVLKGERMQKRRLEAFQKMNDPKVVFDLPSQQPRFDMRGIEFSFSVNSGIQWKAWSEVSSSRSSTPPLAGVIEVVKAPPIAQKRIVRRSGFTIRKLQTSKSKEEAEKKPFRKAFENLPKAPESKLAWKKTKSKKEKNSSQVGAGSTINYVASVC